VGAPSFSAAASSCFAMPRLLNAGKVHMLLRYTLSAALEGMGEGSTASGFWMLSVTPPTTLLWPGGPSGVSTSASATSIANMRRLLSAASVRLHVVMQPSAVCVAPCWSAVVGSGRQRTAAAAGWG
jgi:hypothetical protein